MEVHPTSRQIDGHRHGRRLRIDRRIAICRRQSNDAAFWRLQNSHDSRRSPNTQGGFGKPSVGRGPYNSMSIGEMPIITVAPATANAVYAAGDRTVAD